MSVASFAESEKDLDTPVKAGAPGSGATSFIRRQRMLFFLNVKSDS